MKQVVNLADYYSPHPGQMKLHQSKADEKYEEAGRRFGKSRGAIGELLINYTTWLNDYAEGKRMAALIPHWHCWVVVPDYNQGRQAWNELKEFIPREFRKSPPRNGVHEEEKTIELKGPDSNSMGLVELKSAHDPDTLQTVGLDFLWVSESQDIPDRAMNEKLRPTLHSPGRYGKALFEGIPSMWPDHWFRRGCIASQRDETGRRAYFHYTAFDNPLLSERQKEDIEWDKELMTDAAWRRMYLAQFNLNAGFFRNIDSCISGTMIHEPVPDHLYVAGLDMGMSNDFTVMTIMDMEQRKVVNRYRYDSTTWPVMREHIAGLHDKWLFQSIIIDTSNMGGIMAHQELMEMNLPVEDFKFQGENRQTLLGELQVAIENTTITFPQIDSMIRELRQFQYIRNRDGRYQVRAPAGENDDEVMALALALRACNPPNSLVVHRQSMKSNRYMPTQSETNTGVIMGFGARMMRERKIERMRERQEKMTLQ